MVRVVRVVVDLFVMEAAIFGRIDDEHRRDGRGLSSVIPASFPQDHCHDRILIGFTASSMRGQGSLDGHVTDNITVDDDKISRDNMFPIKISHNITDGRGRGFQERQLLEWRRGGSPL